MRFRPTVQTQLKVCRPSVFRPTVFRPTVFRPSVFRPSVHGIFVLPSFVVASFVLPGYFTLFGSREGRCTPLGFAKGGHFEVKEGHPDFLQITWFFLNAVLLLYLKLFTCLEIVTMLK